MEFDFQHFLDRKRLKQREAASILGVSMGLVGSWASGRGKPSYETILKLIDAGITIQELFGNEKAEKLSNNSELSDCSKPSNDDLKASIREVMKDLINKSIP